LGPRRYRIPPLVIVYSYGRLLDVRSFDLKCKFCFSPLFPTLGFPGAIAEEDLIKKNIENKDIKKKIKETKRERKRER